MSNDNPTPGWVKILITVVGLVFAIGVAWATINGSIRYNYDAIERNAECIVKLEETDKDIINQMNNTEVILRGIQTDIEWIRGTMERMNNE